MVGKVLGHFNKGLGEMGDGGVAFEGVSEFFEVGLSFFDLDKRVSTSLETFNELDALIDCIQSNVVFNTVIFISLLGFSSFSGGHLDGL